MKMLHSITSRVSVRELTQLSGLYSNTCFLPPPHLSLSFFLSLLLSLIVVCVYMHTSVCNTQRLPSGVFYYSLSFLRQGLSLSPELTGLFRLVCQQAPDASWFFFPSTGINKNAQNCTAFYVASKVWNSGPHAFVVFYLLRHLSCPLKASLKPLIIEYLFSRCT